MLTTRLKYYNENNRPAVLRANKWMPHRNLQPPPAVKKNRLQEATHEKFFGLKSAFNKNNIIQILERENEWNTANLPTDIRAGGYLRLYVWSERRPSPALHYEQSLLRMPILKEVPESRLFFLQYARSEHEDSEMGRCPICGSQLLGYAMADHSQQHCPFRGLEGENRIKFIAINSVSYCQHCNSRSGTHKECKPPGCAKRTCHGTTGHTLASDLCGHSTFGKSTIESDRALTAFANETRRASFLHVQDLLRQNPPKLYYRSHIDAPYETINEHVRKPDEPIAGLGTYIDERREFPFPKEELYGFHKLGRRADFKDLVPPEFFRKSSFPLPQFSNELHEYYQEIADLITDLREGKVSLDEMKLSVFPEDMNAFDPKEHKPPPVLQIPVDHPSIQGPRRVEPLNPPQFESIDEMLARPAPSEFYNTKEQQNEDHNDDLDETFASNVGHSRLSEAMKIQWVKDCSKHWETTPKYRTFYQEGVPPQEIVSWNDVSRGLKKKKTGIQKPPKNEAPQSAIESLSVSTARTSLSDEGNQANAKVKEEFPISASAAATTAQSQLLLQEHQEAPESVVKDENTIFMETVMKCSKPILVKGWPARASNEAIAFANIDRSLCPRSASDIWMRSRSLLYAITGYLDMVDRSGTDIVTLQSYHDTLANVGRRLYSEKFLIVQYEPNNKQIIPIKTSKGCDILYVPSLEIWTDGKFRYVFNEMLNKPRANGQGFDMFPTTSACRKWYRDMNKFSNEPEDQQYHMELEREKNFEAPKGAGTVIHESALLTEVIELPTPTSITSLELRINWMSRYLTGSTGDNIKTTSNNEALSDYLQMIISAARVSAYTRHHWPNIVYPVTIYDCDQMMTQSALNGHDIVAPSFELFKTQSPHRWFAWTDAVWNHLVDKKQNELIGCVCHSVPEEED